MGGSPIITRGAENRRPLLNSGDLSPMGGKRVIFSQKLRKKGFWPYQGNGPQLLQLGVREKPPEEVCFSPTDQGLKTPVSCRAEQKPGSKKSSPRLKGEWTTPGFFSRIDPEKTRRRKFPCQKNGPGPQTCPRGWAPWEKKRGWIGPPTHKGQKPGKFGEKGTHPGSVEINSPGFSPRIAGEFPEPTGTTTWKRLFTQTPGHREHPLFSGGPNPVFSVGFRLPWRTQYPPTWGSTSPRIGDPKEVLAPPRREEPRKRGLAPPFGWEHT